MPFPKSVIKEAILVFIKITEDSTQRDLLKIIYTGLAYFQPNVGIKPAGLGFLGSVDIAQYTDKDVKSLARTISEQGEKFKSFENEIKKEEAQLKEDLAKVETARTLLDQANKVHSLKTELRKEETKLEAEFTNAVNFGESATNPSKESESSSGLSKAYDFLAGIFLFSIGIFCLYQISTEGGAPMGIYIIGGASLIIGFAYFCGIWNKVNKKVR